MLSFFPLISDNEQLIALDSWLVCTTYLALKKRSRLLQKIGCANPPPHPHGLSCDKLTSFVTRSGTTGDIVDLRLPSIRRIASVIRKAATQYGTGVVARTLEYDYQ